MTPRPRPDDFEKFSQEEIETARTISLMVQDTGYIKRDIQEIKEGIKELRGKYVPLERFLLVERIVFGLVGLILISVVTALVALVVKH